MLSNKNETDLIIQTSPNLETINNEEQMQKLDLFSHFLVKESRLNNISDKNSLKIKNDIMPEYISIRKTIDKKIKDIKSYFNINNSIFKEMQSKNTFVLNNFRKGFLKYFFGPRGIVTEKNKDLNDFYESMGLKIGLNTQIYAGSLDYYDFLSKYDSYFERLKSSRKSMLKMSENIAIAENATEKLHALYMENVQKKKYKKHCKTTNKDKINTKLKKCPSIPKKGPPPSRKETTLVKLEDNSSKITLKKRKNSLNSKGILPIKNKDEIIPMNKEIENIEVKEDQENDELEKNDIKDFIESYLSSSKSKSSAKLDRNCLLFNNIDSPSSNNNAIKVPEKNKNNFLADKARANSLHVKNHLKNFNNFIYKNKTVSHRFFDSKNKNANLTERKKSKTYNYSNTYDDGNYDINKMKKTLKCKIDAFDADSFEVKNLIFNDNDKKKGLKTSYNSRKSGKSTFRSSIVEEFKDVDDEDDLKLAQIDPKAESIVSPYLNVQNKKKYENYKKNSLVVPLKIYNSSFFNKESNVPVSQFLKKYIEKKNYKFDKATGEAIRKKFQNNCRTILELGYSLDNAKRIYRIKTEK